MSEVFCIVRVADIRHVSDVLAIFGDRLHAEAVAHAMRADTPGVTYLVLRMSGMPYDDVTDPTDLAGAGASSPYLEA